MLGTFQCVKLPVAGLCGWVWVRVRGSVFHSIPFKLPDFGLALSWAKLSFNTHNALYEHLACTRPRWSHVSILVVEPCQNNQDPVEKSERRVGWLSQSTYFPSVFQPRRHLNFIPAISPTTTRYTLPLIFPLSRPLLAVCRRHLSAAPAPLCCLCVAFPTSLAILWKGVFFLQQGWCWEELVL